MLKKVVYGCSGAANEVRDQNLALLRGPNLAATWTVSYDYELPPNTELAQLGAKLAGVYWASTQNKNLLNFHHSNSPPQSI